MKTAMNTARKAFWEKFRQSPHAQVSDVYEKRGEVYRLTGDYIEALNDFDKVLDIGLALNELRRQADASFRIGQVRLSKGDLDGSEKDISQALEKYLRLGHEEGSASCYVQSGKIKQFRERYREANELFTEALNIYLRLDEEKGVNVVSLNIADNYLSTERYQEALQLVERTIPFFSSNNDKINLLRAYQICGKAMREAGNHAGSTGYLNKALRLAREIGEKSSIVYLLCDIGLEHYSRDDYPGAKGCFVDCYDMAVQQNLTIMKAVALLNIGDACHKMNQDEEAAACLERVLSSDIDIDGIKSEAKRLMEEIIPHRKGGESR